MATEQEEIKEELSGVEKPIEEKKKEKSIGKNVFFKLILNLFNIVVPILIGPYVSRKLGPVNMGIVNYSQAIFGYFFIFASFGVYQYGLREISKYRDNREKTSKVFTSLFVITMASNIISTVFYFIFINNVLKGTEAYLACMILTFNLISNVFYVEWVNEAEENYDFITIKTIAIKIVYTILLFVFVKASNNLTEYLILLVLSTFFNNFVSFIYIKKSIKLNFKNLKIVKHLKPMFLVVILSNASVLYTQLDRIMVGNKISMEAAGFYGVGQNVSYMISGLILTVIYVTIPRLTNYSSNDNEEGYIKLLNKISRVYFLFLYPASIGMFVLSKEIIAIYGGVQYAGAAIVLAAFSIYNITLGYESILTNQIMYIKQKEKLLVKIVLLGGIVNLVLNLILLKLGALTATSSVISTMIANIVVIAIESIYIYKVLKVKFTLFSMDKSKYLLISLLFIPATMIIRLFVTGTLKICLAVMVVNIIIYFGILFFIKDDVTMESVKVLLEKFSKKVKNKNR